MHHLAVPVGEHLHLDCAGRVEEPLDVDPAVADTACALARYARRLRRIARLATTLIPGAAPATALIITGYPIRPANRSDGDRVPFRLGAARQH